MFSTISKFDSSRVISSLNFFFFPLNMTSLNDINPLILLIGIHKSELSPRKLLKVIFRYHTHRKNYQVELNRCDHHGDKPRRRLLFPVALFCRMRSEMTRVSYFEIENIKRVNSGSYLFIFCLRFPLL